MGEACGGDAPPQSVEPGAAADDRDCGSALARPLAQDPRRGEEESWFLIGATRPTAPQRKVSSANPSLARGTRRAAAADGTRGGRARWARWRTATDRGGAGATARRAAVERGPRSCRWPPAPARPRWRGRRSWRAAGSSRPACAHGRCEDARPPAAWSERGQRGGRPAQRARFRRVRCTTSGRKNAGRGGAGPPPRGRRRPAARALGLRRARPRRPSRRRRRRGRPRRPARRRPPAERRGRARPAPRWPTPRAGWARPR